MKRKVIYPKSDVESSEKIYAKVFSDKNKFVVKEKEAQLFGRAYNGEKIYEPYVLEVFLFWLLSPRKFFLEIWSDLTIERKIDIVFNVLATTTSIIAIIISVIALNK
jgi:hypothetical protein